MLSQRLNLPLLRDRTVPISLTRNSLVKLVLNGGLTRKSADPLPKQNPSSPPLSDSLPLLASGSERNVHLHFIALPVIRRPLLARGHQAEKQGALSQRSMLFFPSLIYHISNILPTFHQQLLFDGQQVSKLVFDSLEVSKLVI